ncbi:MULTISPECIES: hypothetical protein [Chromobacterium]|uniref:hypothetical protein n=1 Tax=Chromobacterium TaxID=535 RepID=UPI0018877542|nr:MULTISPECIES: hypothetical protein [Chromobacterium]WON85016.1 hypothetical protein OK026_05770 [Chromobacterium haemolyticum]
MAILSMSSFYFSIFVLLAFSLAFSSLIMYFPLAFPVIAYGVIDFILMIIIVLKLKIYGFDRWAKSKMLLPQCLCATGHLWLILSALILKEANNTPLSHYPPTFIAAPLVFMFCAHYFVGVVLGINNLQGQKKFL